MAGIAPFPRPAVAELRDEEISAFARKVASLIVHTHAIDVFCDRITELLDRADAIRESTDAP